MKTNKRLHDFRLGICGNSNEDLCNVNLYLVRNGVCARCKHDVSLHSERGCEECYNKFVSSIVEKYATNKALHDSIWDTIDGNPVYRCSKCKELLD
jgi:DNA-directed RNA polymerase subunit RPC12/RpoP